MSQDGEIEEALQELRRLVSDRIRAEQLRLRQEVGCIRIAVKNGGVMQATVSVGWLKSDDSALTEAGLTPRGVRGHLERAVDEAKVTRDAVVCFTADMVRKRRRSGRTDCSKCRMKLTVSVPDDTPIGDTLACPVCRSDLKPPAGLTAPTE